MITLLSLYCSITTLCLYALMEHFGIAGSRLPRIIVYPLVGAFWPVYAPIACLSVLWWICQEESKP